MANKETQILFMPGADCSAFADYPKTCDKLQQTGFEVTAIRPDWTNTSFSGLVGQVTQSVHQELASSIGRTTLIIAHSRGANLVMPALTQQPNIGVIIASPSMACAEAYEDDTAREFAEARFAGQSKQVKHVGMHALARASNIPAAHAAVMVGEQEITEYPFMERIAEATARGFDVDLQLVPQAPHFIDHHDAYIDAVTTEATRIAALL
jgi:hypothetical protein